VPLRGSVALEIFLTDRPTEVGKAVFAPLVDATDSPRELFEAR